MTIEQGWRRPGLAISRLLLLLLMAGCGSQQPATTPVNGRITLDGKAVAGGKIVFYPAEGRSAMGPIDADGRYQLTTFKPGDGAILGPHRVTIEATRVSNAPLPKTIQEEARQGLFASGATYSIEWLVPEKYSRLTTSPLTAEVKSGTNQVDFALKSITP